MTADEFATATLTWLGVPYLHQGRSRLGVDCIGLPVMVLTEAGALPPHIKIPRNYGPRPMPQLVREIERYCEPAELPSNGIMAAIRWPGEVDPGHIAILTDAPRGGYPGRLYMIHSHIRAKRVVINSYTGSDVERTVGLWRVPGVTYG